VRAEIWARSPQTKGTSRVYLDIDASLVEVRADPARRSLLVARRHPGAQWSLFPSLEYRYWGSYTDRTDDPVDLDVTMRAHAHVDNHIERLKESGPCRFPFSDFEANANWMAMVLLAADLVRWFQLPCFDGYWQGARPRALRWGIFHAPRMHRQLWHDAGSCASSSGGRPPMLSSARTNGSSSSPDRSNSDSVDTRLTLHALRSSTHDVTTRNGAK